MSHFRASVRKVNLRVQTFLGRGVLLGIALGGGPRLVGGGGAICVELKFRWRFLKIISSMMVKCASEQILVEIWCYSKL